MWEGSGHGYLRAAAEEGGFEFWTKMVEGGSSKRRRIWGKFREMLLAWKLELGRGGEEMGYWRAGGGRGGDGRPIFSGRRGPAAPRRELQISWVWERAREHVACSPVRV